MGGVATGGGTAVVPCLLLLLGLEGRELLSGLGIPTGGVLDPPGQKKKINEYVIN